MEHTNHPFRKEMIFQTPMIMFHVNLPEVNISIYLQKTGFIMKCSCFTWFLKVRQVGDLVRVKREGATFGWISCQCVSVKKTPS